MNNDRFLKLLFLLLIFMPAICLATTFKPNELKVNHYYYVRVSKDGVFVRSFIEKAKLISKKNNIYLFAIVIEKFLFCANFDYQQINLNQILGEVT